MDNLKVARQLVKMAKSILSADNTKTFPCPVCGTKVLENTGYCVKCKKKVKKASQRVAKQITASESLFQDYVLSQQDLLKLNKVVDEQTWKLAVDVYRKLEKEFRVDGGQKEAINRLKMCVKNARSYDQGLHRNNIFKAAHALGMKLPSGSF